ncbi:hypothetical protein GCM10020258_52660 [Sphingomonas yabuuchiae]
MIVEARAAHPSHNLRRIDVQPDVSSITLANFQDFSMRQDPDRLAGRIAADAQQVRKLLFLGDALAHTPGPALNLGADLFDCRVDKRPARRLR